MHPLAYFTFVLLPALVIGAVLARSVEHILKLREEGLTWRQAFKVYGAVLSAAHTAVSWSAGAWYRRCFALLAALGRTRSVRVLLVAGTVLAAGLAAQYMLGVHTPQTVQVALEVR